MDIKQYVAIARRWAWLLVVGLALGGMIGYISAKLQTPIYQASTRVIVSRASMQTASGATSSTSGVYDFFMSDQILIQTYIELLKASSIFEQVSQILNYPVSAGQVSAEQVSDTRIISITAEDSNPQHAADIANAVVQALIAQNEELEAGRYKSSDESLQVQIRQVEEQIAKYQSDLDNLSVTTTAEQIAEVQKQMEPLQAEATQLQKDISILTPPVTTERKEKIAELQARLDQIQPLLSLYQQIYTNLTVSGSASINGVAAAPDPAAARLEKTLSLYQQIYLNLINTREAIRLARLQNTQSVNQIEPASVPTSPVRPHPTQSATFGGFIGLALAAGIVFLAEFLDDTIKSPEDVERLLDLPMIGYIADLELGANIDERNIGIYVAENPRSPAAEAFRSLRANLEFAAVDNPLRSILVTSAEASDGKSTVAVNLAAIFAQGGKRVILVDGDMRRPRLHRFLGTPNRVGMTDLFRGSHTLDEVMIQTERMANLQIISSGSLPPNPAELLGSHKMNHLLEEMLARADLVVIDSPPSVVADAQVLSAKVDGVALVVQPGKTHAGAARITREQMDRSGAHVIGAVFNRISRQHGYYYGGYHYYSPYYSANNSYVQNKQDGDPQQIDFIETAEARPATKNTLLKSLQTKLGWNKKRATKPTAPVFIESPLDEEQPAESLRDSLMNPQGWQDDSKK